jgi:demethylmenaquinone methyltransferase/2-methoxy-6-polyprenyl-1,4-benzoquinol methylase
MLRVGKRGRPHLPFTAGDGTRLPFADDTFDAVTISFGLRNIVDPDAGLREMLRVTRSGGRLVVCEFSHPTWAPFRTVYVEYLMRALPAIARAVSSAPDAYVYLAESIRVWPDQAALAARIEAAGWRRAEWRNLSGGVVALHRATA